ncbi:hypothetical protein IM697_21895 [Streptomyces ferrugineus]|uniref:Uncharacterized protein n=1 Tax=Streptomyces ferrugineus TaxID=1413221 RepID=A0A7M2SZ59_9ACTN|nr:hypothetical protein [Streptomyces ferrugineus]QOV40808.1 hypothetical protein IM697_21895 [Streptomyces ferrugineus]
MKRMAAAMAAGIVLAGTASASASASAAAAAPQNRKVCQSTTLFISHTLCVDFQNQLFDADVVRMEVRASTSTGMGHWELFGPRGTIKNSLDGEWKDRTHDWSGYQDGAHGDLWCAVFWRNTGAGYIKGTQPLCVRAGGI